MNSAIFNGSRGNEGRGEVRNVRCNGEFEKNELFSCLVHELTSIVLGGLLKFVSYDQTLDAMFVWIHYRFLF